MTLEKKKSQKETCPVLLTAQLLSDTHTMLIIRDLLNGPKRFCEIGIDEAGVLQMSTRTLTKKLQELEAHGIVNKQQFSERPPRVEYSLTDIGLELDVVMDAMRAYGEKLQRID